MKIDGGTTFLATASAGVRGKPASTSFAQLLASGQSVRGIRSERAFGFSETGIFGASRFFEPAKNVPTASAGKGGIPKEPVDQPQNMFSSSVGQHRYARIDMSLNAPQHFSPLHHSRPTFDQTHSFRISSDAKPGQPKFDTIAAGVRKIGTTTAPQAAIRWKRTGKHHAELTVCGIDDALHITIDRSDIGTAEARALHASFFFVAQQYGMTLQSIRLNNYKANIVIPVESGSN